MLSLELGFFFKVLLKIIINLGELNMSLRNTKYLLLVLFFQVDLLEKFLLVGSH